ncbi:MAG: spore coat protein CotJB, partial [Clostridia bacterium]|nr:spore coat protein CotJB [Clostridia bacterium]
MDKKELLHDVQRASFALVDANLYLDAYPDCEEALNYFSAKKAEHMAARTVYEENCGPLTVTSCENESWQWVKTP